MAKKREFIDGEKVRVVNADLFEYATYDGRYKNGDIVTVMINRDTDFDVHLEMPGEKDGFYLTEEEYDAVEFIEEEA